MPKNLFIFLLLYMFGNDVHAQKLVFDLNGRINFTQPDDYLTHDTGVQFSSIDLNDSTVIRTYSEYFLDNTTEYEPIPGYDLNGLFTIKLSNRFSLRTGIGLNFGSMVVGASYKFTDGDVIRVDTLPKSINPDFPGGDNVCDCYENSYFDVSGGVDRRIHQEMINLSIPADIGYDIIPGKLSIRGGLFFQTPLYAATKRDYIDLLRATIGDTTKCKYVKETEKNTATTGVSNFQWGASAWITYQIIPQWQIEVGARKLVNDMFVKEEYQYFTYDNNSFKPLTFSAGLSYRLYKGMPENQALLFY